MSDDKNRVIPKIEKNAQITRPEDFSQLKNKSERKEQLSAEQFEQKQEIEQAPKELKTKEHQELEEQRGEEGRFAISGISPKKQSERTKKVEDILAKGLGNMYLNMAPEKRQNFKLAGEETARKIDSLLGKTKVKVKQVISLIKRWLSLIPGVNNFFIEQETKIKTDEIMKLAERD